MRSASGAISQALRDGLPEGAGFCIAFSGGRDSTVLLHAMASLAAARRSNVRAVHVNHGLQDPAGEWELHAAEVATRLKVPFGIRRVVVPGDAGQGIEAAARAAAQLGVEYGYGADGNAGPPLADVVAWGSLAAGGSIGAAEPLFPRLDVDEEPGG